MKLIRLFSLTRHPKVLLFKLVQMGRLKFMFLFGSWADITHKAEYIVSQTLPDDIDQPTVFSAIPMNLTIQEKDYLSDISKKILKSEIMLLNYKVPDLMKCRFNADWVKNYSWPNQRFDKYNFYLDDLSGSDVKRPWELSRLNYVLPVLLDQLVNDYDHKVVLFVKIFLIRWRAQNPLAHSVNWHPMEASVRLINIVMARDVVSFLITSRKNEDKSELLILRNLLQIMVIEHGEFIWSTREYTDLRGNHFTANIVALLVGGLSVWNLPSVPARKWVNYSLKYIPREVDAQFYQDGVNIEKSSSYHNLVLQLFLISFLARKNKDININKVEINRLKKAAFFLDSLILGSNYSSNFGDNDSADLLPVSVEKPGSFLATLRLSSLCFGLDFSNVFYGIKDNINAKLLTAAENSPQQKQDHMIQINEFVQGGYYVVRNMSKGFYFIMDVGEVGMKGRGGHGHNDLLSFQLVWNGDLVVSDSGCGEYTSDLNELKKYKSTLSHSAIKLFNEEMADLVGPWRISNHAIPHGEYVRENADSIVIACGLQGYERISKGTYIFRKINISKNLLSIEIVDEITMGKPGLVEWSFPVATNMVRSLDSGLVFEIGGENKVMLQAEISGKTEPLNYSKRYGDSVVGARIKFANYQRDSKRTYRFNLCV